jgi:Zn-dependent M16 (insulinase) family peptidase
MLKRRFYSFFLIMLLGLKIAFAEEYKTGQIYHGFKLLEKRNVKEVNAECLQFEHVQSGARLLKIAANDPNKTFVIAFKTIPESDCGLPHIMEHSVLNGSENFPVKSPFDVLLKGSLHTFMNAMTGKDVTFYPVASMNDKDYFNLMHVYLDAVFKPLLYSDPRILKQEGWHCELMDAESPVVYKGVVYNEMKGAFSSPDRELYYQVNRHLFPDICYRYSSGGCPAAIPTLTYEKYLDFHRKYYHPSNSFILLYGDGELDRELTFVDGKYLSNFSKSDIRVEIPLQKPFEEMQSATAYYSVPEGTPTTDQSYLSLSIVAGTITDQSLYMALNALTNILVNHEAGPVRLALQEAGIGKEVNASLDNLQQNVFQIVVQNANPEDQDRFREIVLNTLRDCAAQGLDKDMVRGVINRIEFNLREGDDAQKGFNYMVQLLPGWLFANDPFLTLEYEKPLQKLKTALEGNFLESVICDYLIDNPHTLLLTLQPKPGLEQEINAQVANKLAEYKQSLLEGEIDALVQETERLIAFQQQEDSPEALATIPLLALSDISSEAPWYPVQEKKVSGLNYCNIRPSPIISFTPSFILICVSCRWN